MSNTKEATVKGLFWNTLDRFGSQIVVTLIGIITARLIAPDNFGIISILIIFSTIATSFVDSGLATSLVRSNDVDEVDYSTMFVFNLFSSCALYLILFFIAPVIEKYNGIDGLALYARVLFLQIIIHAFGIVQYVKALKGFHFNVTARTNVLSIFFSGAIVVMITLFGYGIWALLLQPILYSFFRTVLFWFWGDWTISFQFKLYSLRKHLKFSLMFMASNMLNKVFPQIYYSIIGKNYSLAATGYYYQGNKWGETPNLLISSIIQGTTLSTLAPIQDDYPRFLNACRKTMSTLSFVLFPVSILAICVARPGLILMLSETWAPSIPYFQLLCFSGIVIALTDLNVNFLNIKGKSNYSLVLELIKIALAILVLVFTYKEGILAIIYGQLSVRLLCYAIATIFSGKTYGYYFLQQLRDIVPYFIISLVCAAICFLPYYFNLSLDNLPLLIVQGTFFMLSYCLINHFMKNNIWLELMSLVKSKLYKKG